MRILLLAQFFPPDIGGEERHVFNLANTLAGRGHDVAVATQHMDGIPDEEVLTSGVRVHRFATTAMSLPSVYSTTRAHHPPGPDPRCVRELARIVRNEKPQVIHAHNWIVNSALALRRRSVHSDPFGLVLTLHDYSQVCATKRLMRNGSVCPGPAVMRCLTCASDHYGPVVGPVTAAFTAVMRPWKNHVIDHVVSVSHAVAAGNRIPSGSRSSVIPNFILDSAVLSAAAGVAASQDHGSPPMPNEAPLLFVGDLSGEKGVQTLLRAYEMLGVGKPPLMLVGRRTPDTPVRLPYGAEIHFDWPHEDVMAALRRCVAAVFPSVWPDPCPTVVLEAMACGRAVVSTSVGGITDMIADGESGLLVQSRDQRGLAVALGRVLADRDLRWRLGAAAQQRVKSFTASAVVSRLEGVYAEAATARDTAAGNGRVRQVSSRAGQT